MEFIQKCGSRRKSQMCLLGRVKKLLLMETLFREVFTCVIWWGEELPVFFPPLHGFVMLALFSLPFLLLIEA